jgi:hypothetical protein
MGILRENQNMWAQMRIQGALDDTFPTGLKLRGLERSLYVKTAKFFGASRRLLFNY